MNYKALIGGLILLFLVVLLIVFLIKGKKLESFFVSSEGCPPQQEYAPLVVDEEGNFSGGPEKPQNYNPNDYYMCKNVGWINNDSPYLTKSGQAWYDAEVQCKKDFRCNSFTSYGDPSTTNSDIDYYTSANSSQIPDGTWENYKKPNLYVKTTSPCITTNPVTFYNQNSDGNLQSNTNGIPYKYVNDFITETRGFLNDYNDYRIAKDSDTLST